MAKYEAIVTIQVLVEFDASSDDAANQHAMLFLGNPKAAIENAKDMKVVRATTRNLEF